MTESVQLPDAALDETKPFSVTPLAIVLKGLTEAIRVKMPTVSFVFDPTLSYQESARGQRALRSAMQLNPESQFPLFGFSRAALQPIAQSPYRATSSSTLRVPNLDDGPDSVKEVYALNGQFDLLFRIYARDIAQLETIELLYNTQAAITNVKDFDVHIPWLQDAPHLTGNPNWKYHIQWHSLDDFVAQHDPFLTFSVAGRATINGTFLTGFLRNGYFINTINLSWFVYPDTTTPIDTTTLHVGG